MDDEGSLDTVEFLKKTSPAWQQTAASLPYSVGLAGVTLLGGSLQLSGGLDTRTLDPTRRTGEYPSPSPDQF